MSKDKKTEDIIREKLDGREFPFDEKAWAGMESMLNAQEKKKRFGFFWYFSASMFIALVAGAALYVKLEVKSQKSEAANVAQVPHVPQTITKQENEIANNATLSAVPAGRQVVEGQQNKQSENSINEVAQNKKQNNSGNTTNTTKQQAKTTTTSGKQTASDISAKGPANYQTASAKNVTNLNKNNEELNSKGNGAVNEEVVNNKESAIIENQNIEAGNQNVSENNIVPENNEVIAVREEKAAEQLAVDTATAGAEKQNPLAAPGKETKNAWGVVAGGSVWMPFQSTAGATNNKGMIGFTGGIYYQRTLSKRFDIGVSAQYSSRGALNYDKTFTSSEFGFGVQSDKTIVSPQTLHYLNIPLYLRFNLTQRSHFILGASYYRLLATTSKIEHITEDSFGVLAHSSDKETGDHNGFKKYDVAAFIGYDLTLFDRMSAGLQFSYGFYDITNNNYSGYKGYDKNISLQLLLKYDIIKH